MPKYAVLYNVYYKFHFSGVSYIEIFLPVLRIRIPDPVPF